MASSLSEFEKLAEERRSPRSRRSPEPDDSSRGRDERIEEQIQNQLEETEPTEVIEPAEIAAEGAKAVYSAFPTLISSPPPGLGTEILTSKVLVPGLCGVTLYLPTPASTGILLPFTNIFITS
jgi:hypothetical protein